MTNLEKWVLSLTAEDYIGIISGFWDCRLCPASDFCGKTPQVKCPDAVREWASIEATQDKE